MPSTLSPKEVAFALGVSESSLKRWADDGQISMRRTPGGHRRIAVREVVRFARASTMSIVRPDILGLPEFAEAQREQADGVHLADVLFAKLLDGDADIVRGMVLDTHLSGVSVAGLCDGPLRTAMERIGTLWRHQPEGIFFEHRATDICIESLNLLRSLIPPAAPGAPEGSAPRRPVALGGGAGGDPYLLPSMMAACVMAEAGYRSVNLGPDTPLDTLRAAARHEHARLVWLSCTSTGTAQPSPAELDAFAADLHGLGASLVVGGRSLPSLSQARHPNLQVCRSMAELAAFARGLLAHTP